MHWNQEQLNKMEIINPHSNRLDITPNEETTHIDDGEGKHSTYASDIQRELKVHAIIRPITVDKENGVKNLTGDGTRSTSHLGRKLIQKNRLERISDERLEGGLWQDVPTGSVNSIYKQGRRVSVSSKPKSRNVSFNDEDINDVLVSSIHPGSSRQSLSSRRSSLILTLPPKNITRRRKSLSEKYIKEHLLGMGGDMEDDVFDDRNHSAHNINERRVSYRRRRSSTKELWRKKSSFPSVELTGDIHEESMPNVSRDLLQYEVDTLALGFVSMNGLHFLIFT